MGTFRKWSKFTKLRLYRFGPLSHYIFHMVLSPLMFEPFNCQRAVADKVQR